MRILIFLGTILVIFILFTGHVLLVTKDAPDDSYLPSLESSISMLSPMTAMPQLFTPREQTWIEDHPVITVSMTPAFVPSSDPKQINAYSGISLDYLRLLSRIIGVQFASSRNQLDHGAGRRQTMADGPVRHGGTDALHRRQPAPHQTAHPAPRRHRRPRKGAPHRQPERAFRQTRFRRLPALLAQLSGKPLSGHHSGPRQQPVAGAVPGHVRTFRRAGGLQGQRPAQIAGQRAPAALRAPRHPSQAACPSACARTGPNCTASSPRP